MMTEHWPTINWGKVTLKSANNCLRKWISFKMPYKVGYKHSSIVGIFLISLGVRALIPPYVVPNSPHDDLLFVRLANSLLQGNWLGEFTNYNLIKTPGFAFWMAISKFIGIPLLLFTHTLYLLASTFLSKQLSLFLQDNTLFIKILVVLSFNPFIFSKNASRIYREMLIASLLILILALFILSVNKKSELNKYLNLFRLMSTGLLVGLIYIVKVDPIIWALLPISVFVLYLDKKFGSKKNFPSYLKSIVIIILFIILVPLTVALKNYNFYGLFQTNVFSEGSLPKLINTLESISTTKPNHPYVTVSNEQRQIAYNVSPTFSEIRSYLELPNGQGWRFQSCIKLNICSESATWFNLELNDAYVTLVNSNSRIYKKKLDATVNDIEKACSSGRIVCDQSSINLYSIRQKLDPIGALDQFFAILSKAILFTTDSSFSRDSLIFGEEISQGAKSEWSNAVIGISNIENPKFYNYDKIWLGSFMGFSEKIFQIILIFGIFLLMVFIFLYKHFDTRSTNTVIGLTILWLLQIGFLAIYDSHSGPMENFVQPYLLEYIWLLFIAVTIAASSLLQKFIYLPYSNFHKK
jgi:hypothetical protein